MAQEKINVTFDRETGDVVLDAENFKGKTCLSALKPFEEALGVSDDANRNDKPEINERSKTKLDGSVKKEKLTE